MGKDKKVSVTEKCKRTADKGSKKAPSDGKPRPLLGGLFTRKYALKVRVKHGTAAATGAEVSVDGAKKTVDATGLADYGKKAKGPYNIDVTFPSTADYADLKDPIALTLAADTEHPVSVQKKNVVSAKIKSEYKVVVLDRDMNQHYPAAHSRIKTDNVTAIEVEFEQTNPAFPYDKDATLTCTGSGAVELFTDEACTAAFDGTIKKSVITTGKARYYLRAKTVGKFDCKVKLEAPTDTKRIKVKESEVKEEMGVVEIKLNVFLNDHGALGSKTINQDVHPIGTYHTELKNYTLPEQKVMTDEDKIKKGRFIHTQNAKHHARAKVQLKIDPAQWPAGTDDYELSWVSRAKDGGALKVFDSEWEGAEIGSTAVKVSALKSASGEKVGWIEGGAASTKARGTHLSMTLDRPVGGLTKTAKKNADWARFTVVTIGEVKLNYTAAPGQPNAWDDGAGKFHINFKADPTGRKIKIKAKLSQKIAGVKLHFMLAGDKDNGKAPTLAGGVWGEANWKTKASPGTHDWKWNSISENLKVKDKAARNKFLHLHKETDAEGEAELELTLSRFGGEKYTPACYIDEDPHLAKYIHGHTDLEKKKPVLSAKTIEVSRKFWYETVKVEGIAAPGFGAAVGMYAHTKAVMAQAADVTVTRATVNTMNPKAIYPMYMVRVNGGNGDALVISDPNKAQFFAGCTPAADKPIKIPVVVCDAQWDPDGVTTEVDLQHVDATLFPANVTVDKLILTPPLQGGGLHVSSSWTAAEWQPEVPATLTTPVIPAHWINVRSGTLSNAAFSVDPNRGSLYDVKVTLPPAVAPIAGTKLWLKFVLKGAGGPFLGEYDPGTKRILAVYDPTEPVDFQNTIAHEIGHAFSQVREVYNNGIPTHKWQYPNRGSHCKHDGKKLCLMYQSGPIAGSHNRYCPDCHKYVVVEDMQVLA